MTNSLDKPNWGNRQKYLVDQQKTKVKPDGQWYTKKPSDILQPDKTFCDETKDIILFNYGLLNYINSQQGAVSSKPDEAAKRYLVLSSVATGSVSSQEAVEILVEDEHFLWQVSELVVTISKYPEYFHSLVSIIEAIYRDLLFCKPTHRKSNSTTKK